LRQASALAFLVDESIRRVNDKISRVLPLTSLYRYDTKEMSDAYARDDDSMLGCRPDLWWIGLTLPEDRCGIIETNQATIRDSV